MDDPATPPQGDPQKIAIEMATAKARCVAANHPALCENAFVLAADTICHSQGECVGKAETPDEARRILMQMMDGHHTVVTGVALIRRGVLRTWADHATVRLEPVDEKSLSEYVKSEIWFGKAGGYDLEERRRAGWIVHCDGDPDTVGGLSWKHVKTAMAEWPH